MQDELIDPESASVTQHELQYNLAYTNVSEHDITNLFWITNYQLGQRHIVHM